MKVVMKHEDDVSMPKLEFVSDDGRVYPIRTIDVSVMYDGKREPYFFADNTEIPKLTGNPPNRVHVLGELDAYEYELTIRRKPDEKAPSVVNKEQSDAPVRRGFDGVGGKQYFNKRSHDEGGEGDT